MLSDLRESGSLEQDADVVAFIFREEIYRAREGKDAGDKKGIAEIIIEKQRNGPTATVKLAFIREYTRFENLQREGEGPGPSLRPRLVTDDDGPEGDGPTPF
jgi:replicative DNA helicase